MSDVKLNPPVGFDPYGGASKSYQPSADGAHFFAQCGRGPWGFGLYVLRQVGGNRAEYVNYGPVGERNAATVLSAATVADIRRRLALGEKGRTLAKEYKVSEATISSIKNNKRRLSV